MFFYNKISNLFSFKLFFSYLLFKILITKPYYWSVFLFDFFFFFLCKLVLLYESNFKNSMSKNMNIFLFIKKYSYFFNIKQLHKVNSIVSLLTTLTHTSIYIFLKKVFFFIKTLLFRLYSVIFVKIFNFNTLNTKVLLPIFNKNLLLSLNKKISFYYLFFSNNTYFLYKYLFFNIYCNSIYKPLFKYTNEHVFNINYFISPLYSLNNLTHDNFVDVSSNNNHLSHKYTSKYVYFNNIFIFNNFFLSKKKVLFFFLLGYRLKDVLLYNNKSKQLLFSLSDIFNTYTKKNKLVLKTYKTNDCLSINRYKSLKLLDFLIESKVYNFLKNKNIFMSLCKDALFTLCTYFYTKLITFKQNLLLFFYTNRSNKENKLFKYVTLTHHINYNKVLLSNRKIKLTHNNIDEKYKSLNNIDTFMFLKEKHLKKYLKFTFDKDIKLTKRFKKKYRLLLS